MAKALDVLGERDLAIRLIGQLRHGRQEFKALHAGDMSPELARCFDDPPSDTETVDEVLADLYLVADQLDREGGGDRIERRRSIQT